MTGVWTQTAIDVAGLHVELLCELTGGRSSYRVLGHSGGADVFLQGKPDDLIAFADAILDVVREQVRAEWATYLDEIVDCPPIDDLGDLA